MAVDAQEMEALSIAENRILFIQTAFIGDAILTLPAIQKLKHLYPDSHIDVLCIPSSQEIFEASPFVEDVIVIDKKGKHQSIINTIKFARELKQKKYKKIFSSHRSLRTSLVVLLLGVNESFGFDNSSLAFVYKHLIPYKSDAHEVQRNLDLIGFEYDEKSWRIKPEIQTDEKIEIKINSFLKSNRLDDNFISIAPGSIWETKKYPKKYFKEIIDYFIDKNFKIILVGSDKDKELCESLMINNKFVINTAGKFSVIESIELLKHAKLLISNDSAPTHMGMAADIKVLTIYCSTVPSFGFYPYNIKSKFISYDDLECKPCGIHGHQKCPINTFDCGNKLEPKIILQYLEGMLND